MAWCLTGTRLYLQWPYLYPHEINYMCCIEMAVRVTYECHVYSSIAGWLDAGLQYLHYVSNGDAAVLCKTIDRVHGLWPGVRLAIRPLSIPMMTLYVPHGIIYMRDIEMAVCVTHKCHTQAYTSGEWPGAGPQYSQRISDGDAAVLHRAIDIAHGQWQAPGYWWPYELHWNGNVCDIWVSYASIYIWRIDMGMQYLKCVSNGDTAVLHQTIDRVHGLWPDARLATGHCLYHRWPYIQIQWN